MKKNKHKKIYMFILLICVFVGMFSVVLTALADDYGGNPSLVPVEKEYGYKYSKDWTFSDYINNVDFPLVAYNTVIENKTNTQLATNYKVWGVKKDNYICVGYVYIYSGYEFLTLLVYDKETKAYISAANIYHQYCIEDIKYNDDTPAEHKELEGGSFRYQYSTGILKTNVPIFNSKKACDEYAATGSIDGAVAVPDELKCEKPQNLSLYTDDNNNKMVNIVWKQTDNIKSSYRSQITVVYQYKDDDDYSDMKGFIIDQDYITSCDNVVSFNLSEIITNSGLDISGGYTQINLAFGVFNYDVSNSLGKSDTEVVAILINKNGIFYQLTDDNGNIVQGQPIKNSTQFKNDNGYSPGDFTTIDSVSNNGFINSILSGFGLIGNNGLMSFLTNVFAYVPSWLWSLIGTGIAFMVIIALFKLVVH